MKVLKLLTALFSAKVKTLVFKPLTLVQRILLSVSILLPY